MDGRIKKHRMIDWLRRLYIAISLMASCQVKAIEIEYVAPLGTNYLNAQNHLLYSSADDACAHMEHQDYYVFYRVRFVHTVFPTNTPEIDGGAYSCDFVLAYGNSNPPRVYSMGYYLTVAVCPSPTINPSQAYHYDALTGNCSRTVQSNLVITLSGGSEIEPSKGSEIKTLPIIASVVNQNTNQPQTNPVNVHVSIKVDPTSGGHDHGNNTRPRGGIATINTCTSDGTCWSNPTVNGAVVFNFNAPEASGTHTITATCDGCSNTATKTVEVKVSDLWPIPESVYYALTEDGSSRIIGDNGNHLGNHYLTSSASMNLWMLARRFYEYQVQNGVAIPTLLHLNDASLKWGGKFDVRGAWAGYHYMHDRGNVIDIRANTAAGYIPEEHFSDFEDMAAEIDADAQLHCSETRDPALDNCAGDENRHYHVILN